jgi:hypothetical protein
VWVGASWKQARKEYFTIYHFDSDLTTAKGHFEFENEFMVWFAKHQEKHFDQLKFEYSGFGFVEYEDQEVPRAQYPTQHDPVLACRSR